MGGRLVGEPWGATTYRWVAEKTGEIYVDEDQRVS